MLNFILLTILLIPSVVMAQATCSGTAKHYENCINSLYSSLHLRNCSKMLVKDYTAALFDPMNKYLRHQNDDLTCTKYKDILIHAISKLPVEPDGVFYRGIRSNNFLTKLKIDDCFVDEAFISASKNQDVADSFTNAGTKFIMQIHAFSGRRVFNKSSFKHEDEIILLPKTYLKLTSIKESELTVIDAIGTLKSREIRYIFQETSINNCLNIPY